MVATATKDKYGRHNNYGFYACYETYFVNKGQLGDTVQVFILVECVSDTQ